MSTAVIIQYVLLKVGRHIGIGEAVYILHTVEDVIDISGRRHIKAPKLVCAFREICSRRIPRSFVVVSDFPSVYP
jgi:hypothetical protein